MPVDTKHPIYAELLPDWEKCRDTIGGARAVKSRGEVYLPKLSLQSLDEYEAYKGRALFYAATGRTKEGLVGFIFRKDPTVTAPTILDEFQRDSTLTGKAWYTLSKDVVDQVMEIGRCGTLIDWSEEEGRPYVVHYRAEEIINWRMARVAGRMVLGFLVLREMVSETDPQIEVFEESLIEQYRVYRLMIDEAGPWVQCDIWRKKESAKNAAPGTGTAPQTDWVKVRTDVPARRGKALAEIPFVFHSPKAGSCDVERPPLLDVADVNISHYRTSADIEHGRHFTGLPTAWVAGFPKDSKLTIGSGTAWVTEEKDAKAGFLEFTGTGLGELRLALDEKEAQMSALGARLLEKQKKAAEAAETAEIRRSGETSVLANIANSCSESLSRVLRWAEWWLTTVESPEDIKEEATRIELNTDYNTDGLTPQGLQQLVGAWISGAISKPTLHENLQRGGIISPDKTVEQEQEEIDANPPMMGSTADPSAITA